MYDLPQAVAYNRFILSKFSFENKSENTFNVSTATSLKLLLVGCIYARALNTEHSFLISGSTLSNSSLDRIVYIFITLFLLFPFTPCSV